MLLFQPFSSSFILLIHVMFKQETRLQLYPADGTVFSTKLLAVQVQYTHFLRRSLTNVVNNKLTPISYIYNTNCLCARHNSICRRSACAVLLIYSFLTSAFDGREKSSSQPRHFTSRPRGP